MVKIRLSRSGKRLFHFIIVSDSRRKRDSGKVKKIGFFNKFLNIISYDEDKLNYWISNGAQLTDSMKKIVNSKMNIKKNFYS